MQIKDLSSLIRLGFFIIHFLLFSQMTKVMEPQKNKLKNYANCFVVKLSFVITCGPQYWTTFSRTNSVKVSRNLHTKPWGGLLRCFNKTTTTLSKLWFGGHQSRSPQKIFSNKISVQLLCLIAWRRESKICVSLVFFYIQSKKLLQELGFHDC